MNQLTDIHVIECARLHSEEAKSGNDENFAHWNNNLTDLIHLDPGDKVSVHGAMVSERGAGQSSSIEIKGVSLGFKKTFEFTTLDEKNASEDLPTKYEILECNASSVSIEMRDDTLNYVQSYYIPAHAHNYIHLPRRWWFKNADSSAEQWDNADDRLAGIGYYRPFRDTYNFYDDYYQIIPYDENDAIEFHKPKNNNERYTIMMRDVSYFSESSASGNMKEQHLRDPENAIYRTYKELKSITVPAGFNSPDSVAEQITRQLQNITEERIYEFQDPQDKVDNANLPGFPLRMFKTIATETYKPFNVACAYLPYEEDVTTYNFIEKDFGYYYNGTNACSTTNASGFGWLSQYHIIGCKRPELYEKGRLINTYQPNGSASSSYRGINGAVLETAWDNNNVIELTQMYDKETCDRWRDFFLAQELYPEIWNMFSDPKSGYNGGDTIDNSRWIHINRLWNGSMSYSSDTGVNGNAMLGDSGYVLHSWNESELKTPASAVAPIYYDSKQRDIFYEGGTKIDQYTYGCITRNPTNGRIQLHGTKYNGAGSSFHTMLKQDGIVNVRKIGFDMHFSAPGMTYILPFAGYTPRQEQSYNSSQTNVGEISRGFREGAGTSNKLGEFSLRTTQYKNKLYLGADAPKFNWNGTNFTITDLHTSLNTGNTNFANSPYNVSGYYHTRGPTDRDSTGESSVVYIINPREQWNDWTPARKPYSYGNTETSGTAPKPMGFGFNDNLEAWTIYDAMTGIFIGDLNLTEREWSGTLWDILGFSYSQFNSNTNTRLERIDNSNLKSLSLITTNSEVNQADSKVYVQNAWDVPLFTNMMPNVTTIMEEANGEDMITVFPEIKQRTESVKIVAEKLPTRMIRGYYTIRSNVIQQAQFIGGKKNNTTMPIVGIVDKINGDGDFYFGQESSLQFTVTRPIKLASISCSIHDPDGSYARCSEQSTVLFKIEKPVALTYNVVQEIMEEQKK